MSSGSTVTGCLLPLVWAIAMFFWLDCFKDKIGKIHSLQNKSAPTSQTDTKALLYHPLCFGIPKHCYITPCASDTKALLYHPLCFGYQSTVISPLVLRIPKHCYITPCASDTKALLYHLLCFVNYVGYPSIQG